MIDMLLHQGAPPGESTPREGELYKRVTSHGESFELRYGYYEEKDRDGVPDVIYPNFSQNPLYTKEGIPFATMMQDSCAHFKGRTRRTEDSTCGECSHFERGEEWFGICKCPQNRKPQ